MSDDQRPLMTDADYERAIAHLREAPDDQEGYGPSLRQRMLDAYQGDPVGRETLTVGASAVRLAAVPDFARSAFVTVTANPVRVTFDGTPPAAGTGTHFGVGEHFTVSGVGSLKGLQLIREGAASGTVDVEYFD